MLRPGRRGGYVARHGRRGQDAAGEGDSRRSTWGQQQPGGPAGDGGADGGADAEGAADRSEAFAINSDPERWLVISERATTPDRFLADGFEAGYVWDEHMVSRGNKQVRKPKKDGWYEHGQNCAEYLE
jgi:hypothetical protein